MTSGEQKIFAWCDFSPEMDNVIEHGLTIASILGKELCLFHLWSKKLHESVEMAEARLRGIAAGRTKRFPKIRMHYFVTKGSFSDLLDDLAESYDCILLVAHKKTASVLLPSLKFSGFPFLFISSVIRIEWIYKTVVVPVGYMKKSKDLALWASYLGRRYGATVNLYTASESSVNDMNDVKSNVFSIKRLYNKFNFPFEVIESHSPTWRLQKNALLHTLSLKTGVLIISVTYKTTFLDRLLGLTEEKVIEKSEELSVMCINSHRDFYSFCG